eukprot:tig00000455_g1051.t1
MASAALHRGGRKLQGGQPSLLLVVALGAVIALALVAPAAAAARGTGSTGQRGVGAAGRDDKAASAQSGPAYVYVGATEMQAAAVDATYKVSLVASSDLIKNGVVLNNYMLITKKAHVRCTGFQDCWGAYIEFRSRPGIKKPSDTDFVFKLPDYIDPKNITGSLDVTIKVQGAPCDRKLND